VSLAGFLVGSCFLLRYEAGLPPNLGGDVWEYWYMTESLYRHGTPELRPEDKAAVDAEALRISEGMWKASEEPYAYAKAPDGRMYGVHFWLYALSAVPAKAYLRWSGGTELAALGLANTVWFLLGVGVALFVSRAPVAQRVALVALAASGTVLWYIPWTGAEMFSWSLVLIAVVTYRDRRYVWSGVAAGVAATQNPPIILLGGVAVLAALFERRWRVALGAAAGSEIGLVPYAFFLYHFGEPNLIVIGAEYAGIGNLSWVRTWGLLGDFNHGLIAFVPVLVFAFAVGVVGVLLRRQWRGLLLLAAAAAVAAGVQVAHNWNSAGDGLQRYLVWMIPLAAGVAVEGIGGRWRLWALAVVTVALHTAVQIAYERSTALQRGYLHHTDVAEWVLTHYPRAYWVEPEVFVERSRHDDGWPYFPADFPLAFARPDGTVSKMILTPADVEKVAQRYEVDPAFLETLRAEAAERKARAAGRPEPRDQKALVFYVHPPHGAVRVRPAKN
jgi:hypothetical protein